MAIIDMSKTPTIIPLVLSGGSGTRLWPLSTSNRPKQFINFTGELSLIEETLMRCQSADFSPRPILVGSSDDRFLLAEAAKRCGLVADIILEPSRRDSCAAILAGAFHAELRDPDSLVLVLAADHYIPDHAAFQGCVLAASDSAAAGYTVTFGVIPAFPATGYGYILPGPKTENGGSFEIIRFVEKPDASTASLYMNDGYLWNTGNFLFKASSFLEEARKLVPDVYITVKDALGQATRDSDFIRLNQIAFAKSPAISVDFGIMEKTKKARVFPVEYLWSDIGSWDSVAANMSSDDKGNSIVGRGMIENGNNTFIHSRERFTAVIGIDGVSVISTPDAVLVLGKGHAESVKSFVLRAGSLITVPV